MAHSSRRGKLSAVTGSLLSVATPRRTLRRRNERLRVLKEASKAVHPCSTGKVSEGEIADAWLSLRDHAVKPDSRAVCLREIREEDAAA